METRLEAGAILSQARQVWLAMAQGRHYAELYDIYFRHQSLRYIETKSWRLELGDLAAD